MSMSGHPGWRGCCGSLLGEDAAVEREAGFDGSIGLDKECLRGGARSFRHRGIQTVMEAWEMLAPVLSSKRVIFAPLPAMTLPVDWKMKRSVAVPRGNVGAEVDVGV